MTSRIHSYLNTFWYLLKADLIVYRKNLVNSIIDTSISTILFVGMAAYIMPYLGTDPSYGPFIAIGYVGAAAIFEMYPALAGFLSDLEGDRTILYQCTLPIPNWLVLVKYGTSFAIRAALMSIPVLPLVILLLGNRFSFAYFSVGKFTVFFPLVMIFGGFFVLILASMVKKLDRVGSAWVRFIFPLWFLGAAQFSWQVLYQFSPHVGLVSLANPIVYAMEGLHAATLNPADYLPFGACSIMIVLWTVLFAFAGIERIKAQLDLI